MRMLQLTSPLMAGADVKDAQRLLTHNVFDTNFKPGPVDGAFGETTMRSCKRAHYWIGDKEAQPVFGPRLAAILSGEKPLTEDQLKRRDARVRAAPEIPLRVRALEALETKIGTKESPAGSNICWASEWYGIGPAPWCAMAVSWSYATSGSKEFKKGQFFAYVPYMVFAARAGNQSLAITHDPQPGDIVAYIFGGSGDQVADHTGLFVKWIRKGISFQACEGNTGLAGHDSDGGEVMLRERTLGVVQAFIHAAR